MTPRKRPTKHSIKALGRAIRQAREQAGLTQRELAQRVGIARVTLTFIERGDRGVSLPALEKIARALKTSFTIG